MHDICLLPLFFSGSCAASAHQLQLTGLSAHKYNSATSYSCSATGQGLSPVPPDFLGLLISQYSKERRDSYQESDLHVQNDFTASSARAIAWLCSHMTLGTRTSHRELDSLQACPTFPPPLLFLESYGTFSHLLSPPIATFRFG